MTLVGYLPPVYDRGELLVDGGYCNNLPSDVMQQVGAAAIIGVDVENRSGQAPVMPLGESVSGWWVLWRRVLEALGLGGELRIPSQGDLTVTLCYIAHNNQLAASRAGLDLYVQPPVDGYGLLDYHKRDEIVAKAYIHAYEALSGFEHPRDIAARKEQATINGASASASQQLVGDGELPPVQNSSGWTACAAGVLNRIDPLAGWPSFGQTGFPGDLLSSEQDVHYASD
jgi:predicted acylesterase/phospholipase RssA